MATPKRYDLANGPTADELVEAFGHAFTAKRPRLVSFTTTDGTVIIAKITGLRYESAQVGMFLYDGDRQSSSNITSKSEAIVTISGFYNALAKTGWIELG